MAVCFVLGVTCSGKSTLMDAAKTWAPSPDSEPGHVFRTIEVGRELRKRYPPKHFEGQGAPVHTQEEAQAIFEEQLAAAFKDPAEARTVLVDGQPRAPGTLKRMLEAIRKYPMGALMAINLWCSPSVRAERIGRRFANDAEGFALALRRIENDAHDLYHVLTELSVAGISVAPVCTDPPAGSLVSDVPQRVVQHLAIRRTSAGWPFAGLAPFRGV